MYANNLNLSDNDILKVVDKFQLFGEGQQIKLDKKIDNKSLSSGQMQKISFIRAILSNADTIFLDESTSNLDEDTKVLIFELLKQKNLTIINSTHDIDSFKTVDTHYKVELKNCVRSIKKVF